MTQYPPFGAQPEQPKRSNRTLIIVLSIAAAVLILVGLCCVLVLAAPDSKDPKPGVSRPPSAVVSTLAASASVSSAPATSPAGPAAPASSASPAVPAVKQLPTSFGDGTFEVGVDIAPGTYKTKVPDDSYNCYWERVRGLSGGLADIIANENLGTGAAGVVKIAATDKGFKSDGCGTWTKSS